MRVVDFCVDTGAERNYTAIGTGKGGREGRMGREDEGKGGRREEQTGR